MPIRYVLTLVTRPLVSGVLGGLMVLLVVGQPPVEVRTVVERTVVQQIPGTSETVYVTTTKKVCDTETIARLLNEVLRSSAVTGDAGTAQEADASGDVAQAGSAQSGDAILGQVIRTLNICGSVTINAENTVTDSKAVTGDAEVENEAIVPTPTPSPTPLAVEGVDPSPDHSPENGDEDTSAED